MTTDYTAELHAAKVRLEEARRQATQLAETDAQRTETRRLLVANKTDVTKAAAELKRVTEEAVRVQIELQNSRFILENAEAETRAAEQAADRAAKVAKTAQ